MNHDIPLFSEHSRPIMPDELSISQRLHRGYGIACDALNAERTSAGYWVGELANSALATATAISALSLVRAAGSGEPSKLVDDGVLWLVEHQNDDGGWGDTIRSRSNISTTMLVRAAFQLAGVADRYSPQMSRAGSYIDRQGGTAAMIARYGRDRTFAVPILSNCALAGLARWQDVSRLPFELACLPHAMYRFLRLHVVSYALPALIAIGQLVHAKRPTRNMFIRFIRRCATEPSLRKLQEIQPESGGFLEAIPLTSFVTMSLAALGKPQHAVARKGVEFLRQTVRPDGSWPIDSNLSVWLTTLSVNALAPAAASPDILARRDAEQIRDWLLDQQIKTVHRYTNAAPGGWGWSHLSGSVPDADDTAGALVALANLPRSAASVAAADRGIRWLLDLQNSDGGWPTFCRGWGQLPFDRSGTDLTAHVLRALASWHANLLAGPAGTRMRPFGFARGTGGRVRGAAARAVRYLADQQHSDGSWTPLWFGNESVPHDANPLYGTSKVAVGLAALGGAAGGPNLRRAVEWIIRAQNQDGGWGGGVGVASSVEETALAVEALAVTAGENARGPIGRGVQWLLARVESGDWRNPSPIGLYFAKLWYFEKLYPTIYTVAALGRARRLWNPPSTPAP
jgi:squalene-hopene/tetraprenyl-beta-curcumene cyclase